ncbi:MAG TPA: hypothetical protein DDX39_01535 [Bacteroidales bacterium]|nr:MAG: hypothetical protein A2W98_07750 [Bacteroidetes bacterium GWF2_33_38]OFY68267.1 MAG: hypothetical protein A2265_07480 [Bacteroidetes bacterium RIFOXYA12_FULL_33_9]OFY89542.1 MAG: hypothetical protein A2236_02420 [Bacteroidetes bacterium RIFOXYA2_FULL_33_7]HBF87294.1 hypothetical protein [Bacteroidales bacterium]
MYTLNKQQVDTIVADVEMAKITFLHLAEDLIDHICCEVEQEMNQGKSFNEAYEIIKQQTGIKVLQKIQENTRLLIDKNYKLMKTTMKISGLISLAMLGLATVFKIFHWPGAGIGLVLGFFILCVLFFPSAIYVNYRDAKKKGQLILHLSILVGGIAFMAGILFKVQHWPGANILMEIGFIVLLWIFLPILLYVKLKTASDKKEKRIYIIGVIALMVFEISTAFKMFHWPGAFVLMLLGSAMLFWIFLPMFTYRKFKESGKITGQYIFLITTSMFFILFTFLLAMNVSKNVLVTFVNDDSDKLIVAQYYENKNDKLVADFLSQPDSLKTNKESQIIKIQQEAHDLCNFIHDIKIELIQAVENVDSATAIEYLSKTFMINSKDNNDFVTKIMLGKNANGLAISLKEKTETFKMNIHSNIPDNQDINSMVDKLLDTSDKMHDSQIRSWEQINFYNTVIISALQILSDLELKVQLIESESIKTVIHKNI